MVKLNNNLLKLETEDIFMNVGEKISEYKKDNPGVNLLNLGVGDVSLPIVPTVIKEMEKAVLELGNGKTFKGYGAYYGHDFLREKIVEEEYNSLNITKDEIYISIGTKTDTTNILELFDKKAKMCLFNPSYPIYRDGGIISGREIEYLELYEEDNFIPRIPKGKYDLIYICSPSNPLGIALPKNELKKWIEYAIANDSIILYDNVYESFITSDDVPHSIYEIDGAKRVAIEFRSFSKRASFTGIRCSYYVIPNELHLKGLDSKSININELWKKRTIAKFNGADYIVQKGAWATYLEQAKPEIRANINYYLENAKYIKEALESLSFKVFGGENAPFLWVKTRNNMSSWAYFDFLLRELNIVIIPGCIFGKKGDKYIRISALATREVTVESMERIKKYYEKKL